MNLPSLSLLCFGTNPSPHSWHCTAKRLPFAKHSLHGGGPLHGFDFFKRWHGGHFGLLLPNLLLAVVTHPPTGTLCHWIGMRLGSSSESSASEGMLPRALRMRPVLGWKGPMALAVVCGALDCSGGWWGGERTSRYSSERSGQLLGLRTDEDVCRHCWSMGWSSDSWRQADMMSAERAMAGRSFLGCGHWSSASSRGLFSVSWYSMAILRGNGLARRSWVVMRCALAWEEQRHLRFLWP